MTSNKELAPEEKVIYLYKSQDGLLLLAAGRIGEVCFANSLNLNIHSVSEFGQKTDRLLRGINNSMDLNEKTGWDGVRELPKELPPKPEKIIYPIVEVVDEKIIKENNVGDSDPQPTE